ncbi:MAG: response regulator [Pseudomonadota bacterium]|nr:response regulator [Pseudomonadota bacterium]
MEDDDSVARTIALQLRKLGHAAERAQRVDDLLSGETELVPELIITDIFMPGEEGLKVIRRIKDSPLSHIPVIAISGGGSYMGGIKNVEDSFVAKAALAFGANQFLSKPVSMKQLVDAIEECRETGNVDENRSADPDRNKSAKGFASRGVHHSTSPKHKRRSSGKQA